VADDGMGEGGGSRGILGEHSEDGVLAGRLGECRAGGKRVVELSGGCLGARP
jgi:hypothetical protein